MNSFYKSSFASDIIGMIEWRSTLGYSEKSYRYELKKFDEFCSESCPETDLLTWDIISSYLEVINERRDVRCDIVALRNLAKYQIMLGKGAYVFPTDFYSHKRRKLPHIMTDTECENFFRATDNYPPDKNNSLLQYTVPVIFRIMYATGMRPQEIRKFMRTDFDFKHDTIYISDSKSHRDRRIAVEHKLMNMCRKYDSIARGIYPETQIFFPSRTENIHSSTGLQLFFRKCWKIAVNPEDLEYCSPYILRHNFATQTLVRWIEEGKQLENYIPYLSAYMGHETFHETFYYIHLLPDRIARLDYMDISDVIPEVLYED